ncbi:MAG: hypothetical protein AAGA93_16460 [Actinomycetota bacterium]
MTADDRIRAAFEDLSDRAARSAAGADRPVPDAGRSGGRGASSSPWLRPGLAVAGLAVAVAAGAAAVTLGGGGGGDGQQVATETPTSLDGSADSDDAGGADDSRPVATTDEAVDPDADSTGSTTDPTVDPVLDAGRYRVATAAVAADTADPFLNVRAAPDAGAELVAKLPAAYVGLDATGRTETAADGGTWLEVALLDPVPLADPSLADGGDGVPVSGWVNAGFVEALPDGLAVTTDELPACGGPGADGDDGGGGGAAADAGGLDDGHVYAVRSGYVSGDCLRIVLTFGAGSAPFVWGELPGGTGPATAVPAVFTTQSGGSGIIVDLGPVDSAWPAATETGDGVYIVRADDGRLDLVVPVAAQEAGVTALPGRGLVVVDLVVESDPPDDDQGVVLVSPTIVTAGGIEVGGLARPFEATLGVDVVDLDGNPIEAVFSGSDFLGTIRTTEYGVRTTDWTEAWGRFVVRVEDLAPGTYLLRLDPGGGAEVSEPRVIRFAVEDAGEAPSLADQAELAIADALIDFASGPLITPLPLADEVVLALGPDVDRAVPAAELSEPGAWALGAPDGFAGFSGPFNPLDQLRRSGHRITTGPVAPCAGPPRDWPAALDGLRQVNVEPIGIDSCIAWYGVHLFLDDEDRIAGVVLDLFGP